MSYERNKIKTFLERKALMTINSKTTPSIYYYFKDYSVRYSNHFKQDGINAGQLQVIRKSNEVWISLPGGVDYQRYNEKTGFYMLRKFLKETKSWKKLYKDTEYARFKKRKHRYIEDKKMKAYLKSIKGTKNLKNLIYGI